MKQFAKIALAAFVGVALYDVVDGICEGIHYAYRKRKHQNHLNANNPQETECERAAYSPEVSGRRAIGFKMRGEE